MGSITVRLDVFEGPLDLLCHLIEKNKIDIYDIPIAELTDQYLTFLEHVSNKNMDEMSEFLVMATTLLEIKSKVLLPSTKKQMEEEEGPDPREELVEKLLEYKKFKQITEVLKIREEQSSKFLYKKSDSTLKELAEEKSLEPEAFLQGITMADLYHAFEDVMKRKEIKTDHVRASFENVVNDPFTIQERMEYIRDLLILHSKTTFHAIFREDSTKIEVVVTFLALLEMMKMKEVTLFQKKNFDEIIIAQA